jgi:type VI secretion system protein ImpC
MSNSSRFGEIRLGFGDQSPTVERPTADQPFRILLMGDFSGRASRGICQTQDLATRKAMVIDRDNYEECLGRLGATVRIPVGAGDSAVADLSFADLDDFGPDRIYDKLELFASLRKLRRQLASNDTFAGAAEKIKQWHGVSSEKPPAEQTPATSNNEGDQERAAAGADLLSASLAATPAGRTSAAAKVADWDALVQQIVEPYVLPGKDPRQDEFLAIVDRAISDQMRTVMHRPEFQQLEASWRSIHFLTRNLDTGSSLKIFLLDVSQQELQADLAAANSPTTTGIYKNLVEQTVGTSGGKPWAILVGDYQFSTTESDIDLLARLAVVAVASGAPLLTAADHTHVSAKPLDGKGDPDDWAPPAGKNGDIWQELRDLPESAYLCVTFPGVMLRLPYGKRSRSAEKFDFEETDSPPKADQLLWSNGAYLVGLHLAESFLKAGWDMQPPPVKQVGNLPVFVYEQAGDREAYPCAEAYLVDRGADRIRMQGLTPIRSMKNVDAVQIAGMRALSTEMAELRGRWSI